MAKNAVHTSKGIASISASVQKSFMGSYRVSHEPKPCFSSRKIFKNERIPVARNEKICFRRHYAITAQASSAATRLHFLTEGKTVRCREGGPLSSPERAARASPGSRASRSDDPGRHPYMIGSG